MRRRLSNTHTGEAVPAAGCRASNSHWKNEEYSNMRGLTVLALALLLGGCSFSAPGVHARIGDPDVIHVDLDGHGHGYSGGGSFCPPGHRMKGSC